MLKSSSTSMGTTEPTGQGEPSSVKSWEFNLDLGENHANKVVNDFPDHVRVALNTTSNFRFEVDHLQNFMSTAIFAPISIALKELSVVAEKSMSGQVGKPDFVVHNHVQVAHHTANKKGANPIFCVGEVKLNAKFNITDLVSDYQDYQTGGANNRCEKARKAVIQLYRYMCSNDVQFGVLTTLEKTWVFRRQEANPDIVEISEKFPRDKMVGVLIKTFLAAREVPTNMRKAAEDCSAQECKPQNSLTSGKRTSGKACDQNSSSSSSSSSSGSGSGAATMKGATAKEASLGGADIYPVSFVDLPRTYFGCPGVWKTEWRGLRAIMKTADAYKSADEVAALRHEASIYEHLRALQGVNIPRVLYAGWLYGDLLYGIVTEDCGDSWALLDKENISQPMCESAVLALEAVHACSVQHCDIALRNIVGSTTSGVRIIDFGMATLDQQQYQRGEMDELKEIIPHQPTKNKLQCVDYVSTTVPLIHSQMSIS